MAATKERPWALVVDYAIQSCDGLTYAHSHNLIHRDVKPANLLLDGEGRLLVTDFGLVKRGGQPDLKAGATPTVMDETGMMGTPSHAPPEQWIGGVVGPPADVYSLGVVLYELATGQLPFQPSSKATALHDLLTGHLNKKPPDPREYRPDIPAKLCEAILACLEKDPDKRIELPDLRQALSQAHGSSRGQPQASPQRADALNNKAVSLCYLGKTKDAMNTWNQAAQLDPLHAESVYNRTCLQWRTGQIDTEEARRRLGQVQSDRPWAGAYTAYFHLERGEPKLAERDLRAALEHSEMASDGAAWRALGDALMCQSLFPEAAEAYQQAQERSPADRDVQVRIQLAQATARGQTGAIFFPRPEPVHKLTLPTRVLEMAFDDRRLLARHQFGLECFDLNKGVTAWSGKTEEQEQGLFLSPRYAVSGRDCWDLAHGERTQFAAGERAVAAFPKTDQCLATAQALLHIVELPGGKVVRGLRGNEGQILCAAVTSDEAYAVTGSSDRMARIWDLRTGSCCAELEGHKDYVQAVALTPDGQLALTGGKDGFVRIWRLPSGERQQGKIELKGPITSLYLANDNQHVVINLLQDSKPYCSVWDVRSRTPVFTRPGRARVMPGCSLLLAVGQGAEMELWELPAGRVVRAFHPAEKPPDIFFGSRGGVWVAATRGNSIDVWEADEEHRALERSLIVTRVRGHREGEEARALFSSHLEASRAHLEAGRAGEAYRLLKAAREVRGYDRDPEALELLGRLLTLLPRGALRGGWEVRAFSEPSRERIEATILAGQWAVSAAGRTARLWDPRSGTCVRGFAGHKKLVTSLCMGPEGELLTGSLDGTVRIWDVNNGETKGVLGPHESGVVAVRMQKDKVLTVTTAGQVRQFEPGADKPRVLAMLPEDSQVSFAPDSSWLAFITGDRVAAIPLKERARPVTLRQGSGWPVMVGPGQVLFAAPSGTLELVVKGKTMGSCEAGPTGGLVCNDDRQFAVTMGTDHVKLWRVNPLELLGQLALGRATSAALSDDARNLLVGYADGTMRYWELDWELTPAVKSGNWLSRLFGFGKG